MALDAKAPGGSHDSFEQCCRSRLRAEWNIQLRLARPGFRGDSKTLNAAIRSTAPSWWVPSIHGAYSTYQTPSTTTTATSRNAIPLVWPNPIPSFGPIVALDADWDIGDPADGTWPNGKKLMKIIGFYTVDIREPSDISEIGSGPILADVIWFGPNATCDGNPVQFYGGLRFRAASN